jgi:hypothetical protein
MPEPIQRTRSEASHCLSCGAHLKLAFLMADPSQYVAGCACGYRTDYVRENEIFKIVSQLPITEVKLRLVKGFKKG